MGGGRVIGQLVPPPPWPWPCRTAVPGMGCLRCAAGGMALACAVHIAADAVVGTLLVLLKPRWERFLPLYAALNGAPQRVVARPALPRKAACPGLERIGVPCGPPKVGVWGASRMPQKMLWFIVHMKKTGVQRRSLVE